MATGLLGQAALAATTYTSVYIVPASTFTVFSVSILNRATTTATVRVALADSATPTNAEFIEYGVDIGGSGVLERTGIMMNAGKQLVVYASNANISVSCFGIETSTT